MRIAVMGTGAVGGYFGARLAEAGEDVVFLARGDHLDAIRGSGLRLESVAGDVVLQPARATDDPASAAPVDCVLVAVKSWQLPEASKALVPLAEGETFVVPLLNGVEAPETLGRDLGPERVLGGLCGLIAFRDAPGMIRHTGADPWITFGELEGRRTDRSRALLEALERCTGVRATLSDDIVTAMWEKFLFIASIGGVGAATRAPIGALRAVPETRRLLEAAMREVLAVAGARGVPLDGAAVERAMALVDSMPSEGTSSMQRDVMAGRRSELDAWNGAVVRLGAEVGVDAPVHRALYALLLPQELRARGELEFPEPSGLRP
jgi:2-dehydropantoate 2-reductase